MSRYTTELRYIVEQGISLGLTSYPIFQESYRTTLNNKIIQHFYFREIGFETVALFINRLNERMTLIMPYYNQLYNSALLIYDPLKTKSITETYSGEHSKSSSSQGTSTGTATSSGSSSSNTTTSQNDQSKIDGTQSTDTTLTHNGKKIASDTPQGLLTATSIDDNTWATTAALEAVTDHTTTSQTNSQQSTGSQSSNSDTTGQTSQSNTTKTNDTQSGTESGSDGYTRKIDGFDNVVLSELLLTYRETFLNIDQMIIDNLEDLFMCVW